MRPSCPQCLHSKSGFFCKLLDNNLERLNTEKSTNRYRGGQAIFYQGNPPLAAYVIRSGNIKLFKLGRDGAEVMIRLLRPGNLMGYRALLADEPYAATAEPVDEAEICIFSRESYLGLLDATPKLSLATMRMLAIELRVSEDELVSRVQDSVTQRTARLLLWFLQQTSQGNEESKTVTLPFARRELALMIGTSPETLSRTLSNLAKLNVIDAKDRRITIRDLAELEGLARPRNPS